MPNDQWRQWVVYQVYPRSFADSDRDGVGDLRGVLSHLDHLHRLGVQPRQPQAGLGRSTDPEISTSPAARATTSSSRRCTARCSRATAPVVIDGGFELLLPDHPAIWAFVRSGREAELLIAANFSAHVTAAALPLDPDWADAAVVLTNLPDQEPLQPPPDLKLRPWESIIWRRAR